MRFTAASSNWIEELLRNERKTPDAIWRETFAVDFKSYLQHDKEELYNNSERVSAFDRQLLDEQYIINGIVNLNLKEFDKFVENERARRWIQMNQETFEAIPSLPEATIFSSAAHFLCSFFLRLIASLEITIKEHINNNKEKLISLKPNREELYEKIITNKMKLYIIPYNSLYTRRVRTLRSEDVPMLVTLKGVITRSNEIRPELVSADFECAICNSVMTGITQEYYYTEPIVCWNTNCGNRKKWNLIIESCQFQNWQKMRVQQCTGEEKLSGTIPRSLDVIVRGPCVDSCRSGDSAAFTGYFVALPDATSIMKLRSVSKNVINDNQQQLNNENSMANASIHGIKTLGVRELKYRHVFICLGIENAAMDKTSKTDIKLNTVTANLVRELFSLNLDSENNTDYNTRLDRLKELLDNPIIKGVGINADIFNRFKNFGKAYNLLDRLAAFVAPEIYGCEAVKKGILCLLVSGVEKTTVKDKIRLRGDINLCIVGDPGTAKSQLLKWTESFVSLCIYTSGKSSTAAGLTATVHRDIYTGDSFVEAGALILADTGICCIDEFDKMESRDLVSIHEAMEQQTISISKAGINATMNARTRVLAACSPVEGRYNLSRTLRENLVLSTTLLSRFDMIFVLLDNCSKDEDITVANHIIKLARKEADETVDALIRSVDEFELYIKIASIFRPRLTNAAKKILIESYVYIRQQIAKSNTSKSSRITTRQLESMLRISEAIAKLHYSNEVLPIHAEIAIRLFKSSIYFSKSDIIEIDEPISEDDEEVEFYVYKIDSEEYSTIQSLIMLQMKTIETKQLAETGTVQGISVNQLANWFVNKKAIGDQGLLYKVKKVIKRIISLKALVYDNETKIVKLHPNFTGYDLAQQISNIDMNADEIIEQETDEVAMTYNESLFINYLYNDKAPTTNNE